MEVNLMATLGSAGRNGNFAPAFTVPASMDLVGYTRGAVVAGNPTYRSLDFEGKRTGTFPYGPRRTALYPASKAAAVKAVLDAEKNNPASGMLYRVGPGTPPPWSGAPTDPTSKLPGAVTLRIFLAPPGSGRKTWNDPAVTTLLNSLHTAITT